MADGKSTTTTQKSNSNGSGLLTGGGGDFSNESLFTGDVAFSVPIGAIGGVNVALNYNSNVHKIFHSQNTDVQSGWIGLGWTLTLGSITADINGTRDVYDDHYYYTSAAGSSELVLISGNEFRLKDYQYWKITRNMDNDGNLKGWTIVTDNGTIMRYGNYDKASSSFVFDITGTKATRFLLGIDGVVCNPLNSFYSSANYIAYQWDLSDIQDIAGNHTTIIYQGEFDELSAGSFSTTLKYTRASYPSEIRDFSGRSIQFILKDLTSNELLNYPNKAIQRLYETKCLDKIILKDQNNNTIKQMMFNSSPLDIYGKNDFKRYLYSITTNNASNESLPSTQFDYFTDINNLGENPGALKFIMYPEGGKVEYTYSSQALNNVKLDGQQNYSSNEPDVHARTIAGTDFYSVLRTDKRLETYRWQGTCWALDNTFPSINNVSKYWVYNDYVVAFMGGSSLEIAKRKNDKWVTSEIMINNSSNPDSIEITAFGNNFFVLSHNLYMYNYNREEGMARRVEDVSVVSFKNDNWYLNYIGSFVLGRTPINSHVHAWAAAGTKFFAVEFTNDPESVVLDQCAIYKENGSTWMQVRNFSLAGEFAPGSMFYKGYLLYAGPNYLIIYERPLNPAVDYMQPSYIKVLRWPFSPPTVSSGGPVILGANTTQVQPSLNIYPSDNYFVTVNTDGSRLNQINAYYFNGDSSDVSGSPFSIKNLNAVFGVGSIRDARLALGRDYLAAGWREPIDRGFMGKLAVAKYDNGQWNNSGLNDQRNGIDEVIPMAGGSTLFCNWIFSNTDRLSPNCLVSAYKEENNNWVLEKIFTQIWSLYVNDVYNIQPGNRILANLIDLGPTSSDEISIGYMEATTTGGKPIFSGNPSDYPVATKTVSDGMGNSYTTSYQFENGIYDEAMNYAKYNKVTVVPPGNNGKTVTYFYNDLDATKAEKFVDVPDFDELDGMPYRVEVYSQDNNTEPISTTTNTWTAYAIYAPDGVYHKRLSKAEATYSGVITTTSYEYNNTNGQISKITEPVQVPSDLQGLRDRVTEITYAYSQPSYSSMLGLNMLSQVYEKKVYSVGPDINVSVTSDAIGYTEKQIFSVPISQKVSYSADIKNGTGLVKIGIDGGREIVSLTSNGSGTFDAVANTTYYLSASMTSLAGLSLIKGNVVITNDFIIAAERTEYDSRDNKYYPYKTSVFDSTDWIVTNTISKRNANGSVTESYNGDGIYSTTKYGYNNTVPVAQAANAKEGETGYIGLEEGWQEWSGDNEITNEDYHTGGKSAYCVNSFGPTKNFYCSKGINKNKSYVLEAWVRVVGGIGKMGIEIRDSLGTMPSSKYQDITSSPGTGWQLVRMMITPAEMASLLSDGYLRVWCGFPYSTANYGYVDDVRFYPSDAVMTTSTYDPVTLQVTSKSDANNIAESYIYDTFGRPAQLYNNDRALLSQTDYYSSKENNSGAFSSSDPNYVKTSAYPLGEYSNPIVKINYTDGLGRTIQTHSSSFGEDLVSKVTYDNAGREYRAYKPFLTDGYVGIYDPNLPEGSYSEKVYYQDPLSRVKLVKPMGSQTMDEWAEMNDGAEVINDDVDPAYNGIKLSYTETYQTVGSNTGGRTVSRVYKDKLGNTVRMESLLEGSINKTVSRAKYSMLGKPVSQTDPKGYISSNKYDFLGRLVETTNVDNGTTKNAYDRAGRLRFMIDAAGQASIPNKTLYWKYDVLGRVIEKGYINESWSSVIGHVEEKDYPKDSSPFIWRKKYFYDDYSITPYAKGKLCKVQTNNDDDVSVEVEETFQFDKYGNTTSASQNVPDYEASGTYAALYGYDNMGRVIQLDYPSSFMVSQLQNMTVASPKVYKAASANTLTAGPSLTIQSGAKVTLKAHESVSLKPGFTASNGSELKVTVTSPDVKYTYNQLGQLESIGNSANPSYFAWYSYDENGGISQERLNNQTLVTDYQYDPMKGLLTNISNSKFSETISYTDGYLGGSFYNGSIASAAYTYSGPYAPAGYSYKFSYDEHNRMTVAEHSTSSDLSYGTSEPLHYDENGNITLRAVGDFAENGLYYSYYPGTNKIQSVTGNSQDFSYDQNGNVTSNGSGLSFTYDPFTNLTSSVSVSGGAVTNYQYDGSKERILKNVTSGISWTKTLYLRGMSEYPLTEKVMTSSSVNETERFYVYGPMGLIAIIDNNTNYFVVKDHLGSIREVLDKNSTPVSYYIYNPFGYKISTTVNLDSKYQFTGQEYDTESGLMNFRARMYDSNLGIFYSMDPAGQTHSPFSYCGNNPVVYIDANGQWFGIDDLAAGFIGGLVNLGSNLLQGKVSNFWQGLGYFGAGFASGDLALYGPAGWAAGGFILGASNASLQGAKGWDILAAGGIGTLSGIAGGYAGQVASQNLGGMLINGFMIESPVVQGIIGGAIGGAAGGYVGGFTAGMLMTGNFDEANKMGISGIWTGAGIGAVAGGVSGYKYAVDNDLNPWSGNKLQIKTRGANPDAFHVTKDGVVLPKGEDYLIPTDMMENPHRTGCYGKWDLNFKEFIRIDPGTPPGMKGPNVSHIHLYARGAHIVYPQSPKFNQLKIPQHLR